MGDWPHAPIHRLSEEGTYMVTAATYQKQHFFKVEKRLQFLHNTLLFFAGRYGWHLQAWAVFPNHYHFVAQSPENPQSLRTFLSHLHTHTAKVINVEDGVPTRRIWYQYWDKRITFQKSYLARLNYVHQNAVKHGIVEKAEAYPWCSAAWFERTASRAFCRTVKSFKTNTLNVTDDF